MPSECLNPWRPCLRLLRTKGTYDKRYKYNFKCNSHNLHTDQTCYLMYLPLYRRVSLNCQSSCDETRSSGARHRHHRLIARDPSSPSIETGDYTHSQKVFSSFIRFCFSLRCKLEFLHVFSVLFPIHTRTCVSVCN